jgi:hypothetical protein
LVQSGNAVTGNTLMDVRVKNAVLALGRFPTLGAEAEDLLARSGFDPTCGAVFSVFHSKLRRRYSLHLASIILPRLQHLRQIAVIIRPQPPARLRGERRELAGEGDEGGVAAREQHPGEGGVQSVIFLGEVFRPSSWPICVDRRSRQSGLETPKKPLRFRPLANRNLLLHPKPPRGSLNWLISSNAATRTTMSL